jgi:aspartate 4-decarboxylase
MHIKHISRDEIRELQQLSPFELKGKLIELAGEHEAYSHFHMLNAGRGNPNFIAPTPREAFFRLGFFALEESRRNVIWDSELVGVPQKEGIGSRFRAWLDEHNSESGIDLLRRTLDWGVSEMGFNEDAFVWELADSVIGDHYPTPDRMLRHNEMIVREYLIREMCGGQVPAEGTFDLFATEGGTAAMTYLFNTLKTNGLMHKGDRAAIMIPIFTPYIEIAELAEFDFEQVNIQASVTLPSGEHVWQFPDEEIDKLRDPSVKLLYCVNPTNPPSVRIAAETLDRIAEIVKNDNPDLMIITDDVYGTFINGFRSLMSALPHNTATVYSYSKYFGSTGWRLGVIAVHSDNVFDRRLAALSEEDKTALDKRYSILSLTPREIKFIDRLVADSRNVALNHTAGLSLPQQCQMLLFSAYCILDAEEHYKQVAQGLIHKRLHSILDGMKLTLPEDENRVGYYVELDAMVWAERLYGKAFCEFLEANYEPTDAVFRLAEQTSIVLLNGSGFEGPEWSLRVSLANLTDADYEQIGKAMMRIANEYVEEWRASLKE